MKSLTDMLHILLCQENHIYDMLLLGSRNKDNCYYYLENDISGGESMPDHLKWSGLV